MEEFWNTYQRVCSIIIHMVLGGFLSMMGLSFRVIWFLYEKGIPLHNYTSYVTTITTTSINVLNITCNIC